MHGTILDGALAHVPAMGLHLDEDCAQANGLDLPVVVINLPHRTDRWETLSQRMSAAGITKLIKAPAGDGAAALRALADDYDRRVSDQIKIGLEARPS